VADVPWDGALVGPSFDTGPESVVVSVGSTAYLACRVRQLGDRKVSDVINAKMQIIPPLAGFPYIYYTPAITLAGFLSPPAQHHIYSPSNSHIIAT
jgi:hypothetical protein